jgi:hypothetical protein
MGTSTALAARGTGLTKAMAMIKSRMTAMVMAMATAPPTTARY